MSRTAYRWSQIFLKLLQTLTIHENEYFYRIQFDRDYPRHKKTSLSMIKKKKKNWVDKTKISSLPNGALANKEKKESWK